MKRAAALLLLATLWLLPRPSSALSERFAAPFRAYPGAALPEAAATADFNGDGRLDVATAEHGDDCIILLRLGKANGTLGDPITVAVIPTSEPTSLSAGDMNGDGLPDLVLTRQSDDAVQVILNRGGTWIVRPPNPCAPQPMDAAIGDLNHDGKLDVVAVSHGASILSIFLGNGDGTLRPPALLSTPPGPCAVAIGDPNVDGNPDVVIAFTAVPTLLVLFGDGTGALGSTATLSLGDASPASDVVVARLNGDALPDIAAISPGSGMISVFLGAGGGTFFPPSPVLPASGTSLTAADLNGDGHMDLAYAGGGVPSGAVLLGNGMGAFADAVPFKAPGAPAGILAGRLDGDTNADLIVPASSGNLAVLLGHGDGMFGEDHAPAAGSSPRAVAFADLNGDGIQDAAVSDEANGGVQVIFGDPGFQVPPSPVVWSVGGPVMSLALADVDRDGDMDIVAALGAGPPSNVVVLLNDGSGGFGTSTMLSAGSDPRAVVVRDLNGDGAPDILVPNGSDGTVSIFYAGRSGFLPPQVLTTGGRPVALAAVNLIGDPHIDLAIVDEAGNQVLLYLGSSVDGFLFSGAIPTPPTPQCIVAGDWTQDGLQDFAVGCGIGQAAVFVNDPDGGFSNPGDFPCGGAPGAIGAADLDGDGLLDLVVTNPGQNTVSMLRAVSTAGLFGPPEPLGTGAEPRGLALLDLDGDLDPDLVVACHQGPGLQVLRNMGAPVVPDLPPSLRVPPSPIVETGGHLSFVVTAEDLDGDRIGSLTATGLPAGATFTTNSGQTAGTITFSPTAAQVGDYAVTFAASNALTGSASTTIHVADASTKAAGLFLWTTTDQDVGTHVVRFRAANQNGEVSRDSVTITVAPPGGTAPAGSLGERGGSALAPNQATKGPVISVTGDLSITSGGTAVLDVTASGADTLTTNTSGTSSSGDATLAVDYQPEVSAPAHVSAVPGQAVTFQVTASDPNQDAITTLTADLGSLPPGSNAAFTAGAGNTSGTFTWTPAPADSGTYGVTFLAANALTGQAGTEIHVDSGPASYWKLNGNGSDELGLANLAPVGSPVFAPALLGQGLSADGTGGNGLQCPATTAHDVQGPWTVELWMNPGPVNGQDQAMFGAHDASLANLWAVGVTRTGAAWFVMHAGGTGWDLRSTTAITGGGWHHVALTTDGTTMTLYVDGVVAVTGSQGGMPCVVSAGGTIAAGLGLPPLYPARPGFLDEVRIWKTCRTQAEIVATMNAEMPQFATDIATSPAPARNALLQNTPNPFNPHTVITFETAHAGRTRLRVFDARGRLVATLLDAELPAGRRRVAWAGTDGQGRAVASGIYFYRIEAPGYTESRRMAIAR